MFGNRLAYLASQFGREESFKWLSDREYSGASTNSAYADLQHRRDRAGLFRLKARCQRPVKLLVALELSGQRVNSKSGLAEGIVKSNQCFYDWMVYVIE